MGNFLNDAFGWYLIAGIPLTTVAFAITIPLLMIWFIIPAARHADLFRPGRKTFFFEKKKQKTFGYWDPRQPKAEAP